MKRRNFFALLIAPIVAKFWPKPKVTGEVLFFLNQDGLYSWSSYHPQGELISMDMSELMKAYYTN